LKREIKKVVVLGAGAVGCYFGGMLARSGKNVLLIARDNHVKAIKKNGLFMDCQSFQEHVDVDASSSIEGVADADLILVCVKSPDTKIVMQEIKDLINPGALILSLQNGVDNTERISQVVSNKVFPAVVYVATSMSGDGHVKHFGRGELIIGNTSQDGQASLELQKICDLFLDANIPCNISEGIQRELWLKFLVNCSYNGISAIGQISYGEMAQQENIKKLIDNLTTEFLLVANKENISISADEAKIVNQQIARTMASQKSSTAQDLMRQKPTEIDYLNGLIIQKASQYDLDVPNHKVIYALVKMLENKHKRQ
jgi:2-dehydropantoate 2-reductase